MYRLSFLHGSMPNDGNKRGAGRQVRNRPGQMRFMRHMRVNLPGFGNFPGTIKNKMKNSGAPPPFFYYRKRLQNAE